MLKKCKEEEKKKSKKLIETGMDLKQVKKITGGK